MHSLGPFVSAGWYQILLSNHFKRVPGSRRPVGDAASVLRQQSMMLCSWLSVSGYEEPALLLWQLNAHTVPLQMAVCTVIAAVGVLHAGHIPERL